MDVDIMGMKKNEETKKKSSKLNKRTGTFKDQKYIQIPQIIYYLTSDGFILKKPVLVLGYCENVINWKVYAKKKKKAK